MKTESSPLGFRETERQLEESLDVVQHVARGFSQHLVAVRLRDQCAGNLMVVAPGTRPGASWLFSSPSKEEEFMLDLVVATASLIETFRTTFSMKWDFPLNNATFVSILAQCEQLQNIALTHRDVCDDSHGKFFTLQVGDLIFFICIRKIFGQWQFVPLC
jgi:hypothetical protein